VRESYPFIDLNVAWYSPSLLMALAAISLALVQKFFASYLSKWGFAMSTKQISVDEDLPYFFSNIKYGAG